jgi:hypothetical protein
MLTTMMAPGAPAGGDLRGTVSDESGKPRPGVTVWLSAGLDADATAPVLARASTDANGRFTLPVPARPPTRRSQSPLSVWAHEPGAVPALLSVPWASSVDRDELALVLVPAPEWRLTLLWPDGKPLVGARVFPDSLAPSNMDEVRNLLRLPDELAERLGATSGTSGEVVLTYLDQADHARFRVVASGLGTQIVWSEKPITLSPVGRLVGKG